MTDQKEPSEVSGLGEQPTEAHLEQLMERAFLTGDPDALREYVAEGGDIDRLAFRELIVDMMSAEHQPNPGGSIDVENISFYIAVRLRMGKPRPKLGKPIDDNATLQEKLKSLETVGKMRAIEELALERNISYEGGRSRYKKGDHLFRKKFGRGV
jgi:hypothetical protein